MVIYPEEETQDSRGNIVRKPSAVGVVVTGVSMMPLASTRVNGRIHNDYRLLARTAPLGTWSRVEWNDKTLHVIDGPHTWDVSDGTAHITAVLRETR